MLTTHKISADFYDASFELIAIHSNLEDYALTYAINSNCGLHLRRMANDLQIGENRTFSLFDWDDDVNDFYWTLISNKCTIEETVPSEGFFENSTAFRTGHLVDEHKEVDYFFKMEGVCQSMVMDQVKTINTIAKVVTAYPVDVQTLKSKRNLIF